MMKTFRATTLCCLYFALLGTLSAVSIHEPSSFFTNELLNPNGLSSDLTDQSLFLDDEDAKLTVPEIIEKYGYPVEVHDVTTADGYILQLHRIPYGRQCGPAEGKKVVFVQHGLLCDSSNWVLNGVNKSLGYLLADECYDVWLGNARGNTYSRRHVIFDPDQDKEAFWSFSWNEMGQYDLPANFDYIMDITGTDGLYYIGHSMGTTMFFICMAERPEYNSKIKIMSALAPVAHTEHMISPIALIAPFSGEIQWLLRMLGQHEFLPSNEFLEFIGQAFCKESSPISIVCSNILFLVGGFNSDQIDAPLLPVMLGHVPAGASVRSLVHYAQGVPSGKFRKFDFGRKQNLEVYGASDPPEYDFSKISAPIALFWGQNDWLGTAVDAHRVAALLPNIQLKYRIPHDKFNHLDFLFAKDIRTLVNDKVIDFMRNF